MANLIQTIPVRYTTPQATSANQVKAPAATVATPVIVPQTQASPYQYTPAVPLNTPNTTPVGVKEIQCSGHLVKENIFQSAVSTVKAYRDNAKYFYDAAFKGEGKDYSVGKINDLTIRAGSLGIACVLAATKAFPFAKGMEFVGLGTWFASMAIWPQVLGLGIKAKTGVNINQRYIDSYGRRKFVYEDNGYRPMDIFRHADLNGKPLEEEEYNKKYKEDYVYLDKIGDDLGIPRDIKNRHEAIMNKMGQVSVQGKTLWMMTAGVMTPIISSLAADATQKPIQNYLQKSRYAKQESNINKLGEKIDSLFTRNVKDVSTIANELGVKIDAKTEKEFESLNKTRLSKPELEKLQDFMSHRYFGTGFHEAIEKEMVKTMNVTEPIISVTPEFRENLKRISKESVQELASLFKKNPAPQEILNFQGFNDAQIDALLEKVCDYGEQGKTDLNQISHKALANLFPRDIAWELNKNNALKSSHINKLNEICNRRTAEYFDEFRHFNVDTGRMSRLFRFVETNVNLKEKIAKFEEVSIKNISESITAYNWERLPQKYFKALGFNKSELAQIAATDSTFASKVISKKFEEIAANPERFEKVIETMSKFASEAISKEEKAAIALVGTKDKPGIIAKVKMLMERTAGENFGHETTNSISTFYQNKSKAIKYKVRNTTDSLIKPIKGLDIYKNITKVVENVLGKNADEYANIIGRDIAIGKNDYYMFHNISKKEDYQKAKELLANYVKDVVLEKNDINNWATKFEAMIPGLKRGMNNSKCMQTKLAEILFGELSPETSNAIKSETFVKKVNSNNWAMRGYFVAMENRLWKHTKEDHPVWNLVKGLFEERKLGNYQTLLDLFEERRLELSPEQIKEFKLKTDGIVTAIKSGHTYDVKNDMTAIADILNFKFSNSLISDLIPVKVHAEITGKNTTDFLKGAAQNIRSRNKWSKLVYGLLIGTTAISAAAIALIGRKNYYNKDQYEKKTPQEVNNAAK